MKLKILLCALVFSLTTTNASAFGWGDWGDYDWGDWCHTDWEDVEWGNWGDRDWNRGNREGNRGNRGEGNKNGGGDGWTGWDGWDDKDWGWDRGKKWGDWCKDKCKGEDCDPTGVPSPTAALMGLGAMGLMLTHRRRRD